MGKKKVYTLLVTIMLFSIVTSMIPLKVYAYSDPYPTSQLTGILANFSIKFLPTSPV